MFEEDPLCPLSVWLIWQFKTVIRRDMGLWIEDIALVCRHKLRLKTFIISIFCLLIAFFYGHGTEIICIVYCCTVNTQLIFLLSRQYSENKSRTPKIKPHLKKLFSVFLNSGGNAILIIGWFVIINLEKVDI